MYYNIAVAQRGRAWSFSALHFRLLIDIFDVTKLAWNNSCRLDILVFSAGAVIPFGFSLARSLAFIHRYVTSHPIMLEQPAPGELRW